MGFTTFSTSFTWVRRVLAGISFCAVLACAATPAYAQAPTSPNLPEPDVVSLINPIDGTSEKPSGITSIPSIIGGVISKALGIMGSLALLVFVYGGFMWLTAAGNSDKVHSGSQAMIWAAIGIFIIFSSYAILSLVLKGLGADKEIAAPPPGAPAAQAGCLCTVNGVELQPVVSPLYDTPEKCEEPPDKTDPAVGDLEDCKWMVTQ